MEVGTGKLADQSDKDDCYHQEWQRQAVRHEHQWKTVVMHSEPVAESHDDRCGTTNGEFPKKPGET